MYYYGRADGEAYKMPLKAETTYYVSVDAKNWGSTNKPLRINVTGPEGFTAQSMEYNIQSDADKDDVVPQNFFILFTTTDAGNYVINFQCPGSDSNKHNVMISNVELFKAASAVMNITDAKYATFVAPFDVTIPDGVTASTVSSLTGTTLNLQALETTIPANTPVVLNSETALSQTFYGKAVEGEPVAGLLTGVYEDTEIESGYVLVNRNGAAKFAVVDGEAATVPANRAYLTVESSVKEFSLEQATGISTVVPTSDNLNEPVFNLAGQRVGKDYQGIIIKNGKKQLNK